MDLKLIDYKAKEKVNGKWEFGFPYINEYGWSIFCLPHSNISFRQVLKETISQYSGFRDKDRVKIYYNCDIVRLEGYVWQEAYGAGFYTRTNDIDFVLDNTSFGIKAKVLNPPKNFQGTMSLGVIFNQNNAYHHLDYPSRMTVIGTIFDEKQDKLTNSNDFI